MFEHTLFCRWDRCHICCFLKCQGTSGGRDKHRYFGSEAPDDSSSYCKHKTEASGRPVPILAPLLSAAPSPYKTASILPHPPQGLSKRQEEEIPTNSPSGRTQPPYKHVAKYPGSCGEVCTSKMGSLLNTQRHQGKDVWLNHKREGRPHMSINR